MNFYFFIIIFILSCSVVYYYYSILNVIHLFDTCSFLIADVIVLEIRYAHLFFNIAIRDQTINP